jgi:hypothetical protein
MLPVIAADAQEERFCALGMSDRVHPGSHLKAVGNRRKDLPGRGKLQIPVSGGFGIDFRSLPSESGTIGRLGWTAIVTDKI